MKRLDWRALGLQLQIMLRRIGAIPAVACVMVVLGLAGWVALAVLPNAESAALARQFHEAQQQLRATPTRASEADAPQRALLAFDQVLGERSSVDPSLRKLFDEARRLGLGLEQGEYRWQSDRSSVTDRYQVRLTTKGSYSAVRAFCERTLLAVPFASLDELNLRREAIDDDAVMASLLFTLHLRGAAADAALLRGAP